METFIGFVIWGLVALLICSYSVPAGVVFGIFASLAIIAATP